MSHQSKTFFLVFTLLRTLWGQVRPGELEGTGSPVPFCYLKVKSKPFSHFERLCELLSIFFSMSICHLCPSLTDLSLQSHGLTYHSPNSHPSLLLCFSSSFFFRPSVNSTTPHTLLTYSYFKAQFQFYFFQEAHPSTYILCSAFPLCGCRVTCMTWGNWWQTGTEADSLLSLQQDLSKSWFEAGSKYMLAKWNSFLPPQRNRKSFFPFFQIFSGFIYGVCYLGYYTLFSSFIPSSIEGWFLFICIIL